MVINYQLSTLVSAWLLSRTRVPPGPVLQRAYGVLDKYRISRTFFLKSDQENCVILPPPQPALDPTTLTPARFVEEIKTEEDLLKLRKEIFGSNSV